MTWIIRGYRPGADDLQHEVNLDLVLKEVFRRLLGLPEGDELLDSYPLDAGAVRQVAARFDLDLDSTAADFFLDQDAPWPPSTGPGA